MRYPLPLASHDSRSVLAVKGSLRRFAPWTAPERRAERNLLATSCLTRASAEAIWGLVF